MHYWILFKMNGLKEINIKIAHLVGTLNESIEINIYLTLIPTDEGKDTLKKYKELWDKIRDLIRSITNKFDSYDEKYMKIKFNSDDLP